MGLYISRKEATDVMVGFESERFACPRTNEKLVMNERVSERPPLTPPTMQLAIRPPPGFYAYSLAWPDGACGPVLGNQEEAAPAGAPTRHTCACSRRFLQ